MSRSVAYEHYGPGVKWAPRVPAHWSSVAIRWIARIYAGGTPDKANFAYWENGTVPWLNSGSVNEGVITKPSAFITEEALANSSARWVPARSVVIALAGQGKTKGTPARLEIASTTNQSMAAIVPSKGIDHRFVYFWLVSNYQSIRNLAGGDLRDGLNLQHIGSIEMPLPPDDEQRLIADYLDRETRKVDALVAEQEGLVNILRERRRAIVDAAFAGADPTSRIRYACLDVVDCPHTTPEVTDDGEYEAVRTASVRNGAYRPGNGLRVNESTWRVRNAAGKPAMGDILFTREAPAGEACMVPREEICLGQRMVLLRINPSTCHGRFLLWQLYSRRVQDHFRLSVNGSTVGNVRLPVLRATPIWLPPVDEQRRIADDLDEQAEKIDALIAEAEGIVAVAKERRSALITAAVTGQIDVRGEVA